MERWTERARKSKRWRRRVMKETERGGSERKVEKRRRKGQRGGKRVRERE